MELFELEEAVRSKLPEAEVNVETDGYYYNFTVIAACFAGLSAVKRQQLVYAGLSEMIADGRLHAVTIKTFTPEETSF